VPRAHLSVPHPSHAHAGRGRVLFAGPGPLTHARATRTPSPPPRGSTFWTPPFSSPSASVQAIRAPFHLCHRVELTIGSPLRSPLSSTELPSGFAHVPSCSSNPPHPLSHLKPPVFELFPTTGPLLYCRSILGNHHHRPPFSSIHDA
jgi:hypothetical protein